jgi:hypothetical protein
VLAGEDFEMQDPERGKGWTGSAALLAITAVLNCALIAIAMIWLVRRPAISGSSPEEEAAAFVQTQHVVVLESAPGLIVTNAFHWREIESTNFETYVANLRAVGCPERTLRDIVLADVRKHYRARWLAEKTNMPFWMAGRRRQIAERAEAEREALLEEEQRQLIQRLLGSEWFQNGRNGFVNDNFQEHALMVFLCGPMPEEIFERLLSVISKYEALKERFERSCGGLYTEEDTAERRKLVKRMEQETAGLMTSLQFEELTARGSAFELLDKSILAEGMDMTPTEARQIALAQGATATGGLFELFHRGEFRETEAETEAREMAFTNRIAMILGEKRFTDYQRARDLEFQAIFELTQGKQLPREVAVKVYEARKLAAEEVQRIRSDAGLDEPARQQRFQQMEEAIQVEVINLLGQGAYDNYLRQRGAWMTNMTRL